ncbi:S8 family serine peptidase [Polluticaenibacter yanchengensis]|uniref:S8 family serine peptidase n=1 Tax=Polluticaenibacter yanchengensis TaxID=3014562 RepID=A0ABT4UEJ5_9BACT|nr:S8 family serine peptidase [Chitinophagaceae bacterium LY-5]
MQLSKMMSVYRYILSMVLLVFSLNLPAQTINKNKLYVKFRDNGSAGISQLKQRARVLKSSVDIPSLNKIMNNYAITGLTSITNTMALSAWSKAAFDSDKVGMNRWMVVEIADTAQFNAIKQSFENATDIVEFVAVDSQRFLDEAPTPETWLPNDSLFVSKQWYLNYSAQFGSNATGVDADINYPEAAKLQTGNPGVIVAVLDGAADTNHTDLRQNLWLSPGGTERFGYNFYDDNTVLNASAHGTRVCGVIGAVNNNVRGISSVAGGNGNINSGVRIMSLQIFNESGYFAGDDQAARAFIYAALNGAAIANCSWSGGEESKLINDAIDYFTLNGGGAVLKGGVVVFSSGNSYNEVVNYPNNVPSVISVTATDYDGKRPSYATVNTHVDIAAPGGNSNNYSGQANMVLLDRNNGYTYSVGTSYAAPLVSGVAALGVSHAMGRLTNYELRRFLLGSAKNIDAANPELVGKMGAGLVDAYQFLKDIESYPGTVIGADTAINLQVTQTCDSVKFTWDKKTEQDTLIILMSDSLIFGIPDYRNRVGEYVIGGGKVVYNHSSFNTFSTDIVPGKKHYFSVWVFKNTTMQLVKSLVIDNEVKQDELSVTNTGNCLYTFKWSNQSACYKNVIITASYKDNAIAPTPQTLSADILQDGGYWIVYRGTDTVQTINEYFAIDSTLYFKKYTLVNGQYMLSSNTASVTRPNYFSGFTADRIQQDLMLLTWDFNEMNICDPANDSIFIVYSTAGRVGLVEKIYKEGDAISGGGTVLYKGSGPKGQFLHQSSNLATNACYKIFVKKFNYSAGIFTCANNFDITYEFIGSGNWSMAENWKNSLVPPAVLPAKSLVIINPAAGQKCILDVKVEADDHSFIWVYPNKAFEINDNFKIEN